MTAIWIEIMVLIEILNFNIRLILSLLILIIQINSAPTILY